LKFCLSLTLAGCLFFVLPANAETISGTVTQVGQGGAFEIDGQAVRLTGVYIPVDEELWGERASGFLGGFLRGNVITCRLDEQMSQDGSFQTCYLNGHDIGLILVQVGLARDCPRYSGGRYAEAERDHVDEFPLPDYCK